MSLAQLRGNVLVEMVREVENVAAPFFPFFFSPLPFFDGLLYLRGRKREKERERGKENLDEYL